MKTIIVTIIAAVILLAATPKPANAQYAVAVVSDPIAQAIHADDISKWLESIQDLNTQINQLNQSIQIAQTVKGYLGDPKAAAGAIGLDLLGSNSLQSSVGQLSSQISQTANGIQALQNNGGGLFTPVQFKTPSGFDMQFNSDSFKPFSAIQEQGQNVGNVISDTAARIQQLQQDKANTLTQIKSAATQAEVQKLQAKLDAIDSEIAALGAQQNTASEQLVAQDIANRNDREMQAQAANAAADQEMTVSLNNYTQWQGQITSTQQDFR